MSIDDPRAPGLSPELIDELCSADLDGELEAACTDLGITVDDARAVIAARHDRQSALRSGGARVAARIDGDELDELERRRLGRAAVTRASRPNVSARRRYMALGGAVAAIAAVAIGVAVNRGGSTKALPTAHGPSTGTIATVDVGAVKDGRDLAHKVHADDGSFGTGYKPVTTAPPNDASTTVSSGAARCLAKFPIPSAVGVGIVATARLRGERIVVATGTLGNGVVVWGFRPADCSSAVFYTGS